MTAPTARRAGSALVWNAIRHGGGKGIFLIRLLILARLLSPDDFGLMAIAMVALGLVTHLTDFGMIPALVQRHTLERSHYDVAWTVGLVRSVIVAFVVFSIAPFVAQLFDEPRATAIIQVLAVHPLLGGLTSIKVAELIRDLRFRSLAFIHVPEALANTVIAVALAPSLGVWALVAGALAGPAAVLVMSYLIAPHRPRLSLDRQAAESLIRFGRWIFLTGVIVVLQNLLLRLIITRQLGTAALGLYYLGSSLAFLASEAAGEVIGGVTFPLFARLQGDLRKVAAAFRSVLTGTLVLLVPVCALLIALAPAVVQHILGPKWAETIPVIRILTLASVVGLPGSVIGPILKGLGMPSKAMILNATRAILLLAFIWIFTERWGLAGAALAWLPAVVASQFVGVRFAGAVLPQPFAGLAIPAGLILGVSAAGALFAAWLYGLTPTLTGLVTGTAVSAVGMSWILWMADRRGGLSLADAVTEAFPQLSSVVNFRTREDRNDP